MGFITPADTVAVMAAAKASPVSQERTRFAAICTGPHHVIAPLHRRTAAAIAIDQTLRSQRSGQPNHHMHRRRQGDEAEHRSHQAVEKIAGGFTEKYVLHHALLKTIAVGRNGRLREATLGIALQRRGKMIASEV